MLQYPLNQNIMTNCESTGHPVLIARFDAVQNIFLANGGEPVPLATRQRNACTSAWRRSTAGRRSCHQTAGSCNRRKPWPGRCRGPQQEQMASVQHPQEHCWRHHGVRALHLQPENETGNQNHLSKSSGLVNRNPRPVLQNLSSARSLPCGQGRYQCPSPCLCGA